MKKYFVIGNPIEHSLSPRLHNFWIKENNLEAIYDKKKVTNSEIKSLIQNVKNQKIQGLNVTVPFKKVVIQYLDKLSPEAEKTQSVNTILYQKNSLTGYNTDIAGFTMAIKGLNFDMRDKKVFILGAGGVVPSIIYSLNKMQVSEIFISNRTRKKAEKIKNYFDDVKIHDWGNIPNFDVIINATSVGLKNENINLDFSTVGPNKLFYDVIYNPNETNFLKKGKELGNKTENGKWMFIYQAFEAFKLWHGIVPKINTKTLGLLEDD